MPRAPTALSLYWHSISDGPAWNMISATVLSISHQDWQTTSHTLLLYHGAVLLLAYVLFSFKLSKKELKLMAC